MQPKTETAVMIPRGELQIEPRLNPRFVFRNLAALGASLRRGQVEPLIVRRSKGGSGYDVGAGARRLKAAELEKLPELLCIVRELSDAEMIAMSVAENGDREDLHPLEEGAAYARLLSGVGLGEDGGEPPNRVVVKPRSLDQVAELAGRSKGYVLSRVRLHADLGPKVREAFLADRFSAAAAQAFLAAGSKERQDLALEEVLHDVDKGQRAEADFVRRIVKARFLLRLADARFPLDSGTLVVDAGSCGRCPKNSANQPELFEGARLGADALCTDAACFAKKKAAHLGRFLEEAKADGQEEVKPREAKQAFAQVGYGSAWVPADVPLLQDDKGRTLDALLGRDKVARGYALDEAGWARSLVRRADAAGGLRRAGHAAIADAVEQAGKPKEAPRAVNEAERARVAEAVTELVGRVEGAWVNSNARSKRPPAEVGTYRALVAHLAEQALPETLVAVVRRRGLDDAGGKGSARGRARAMVVGAAASMMAAAIFGLAVELVAQHDALAQAALKPKEREGRPLWSLLDAYGVDVLSRSSRVKAKPPEKKPKPAAKPAAAAAKKARK